jgi:hypothetical protein
MVTGTVTFQANDRMDVFHVAQVKTNDVDTTDAALLNLDEVSFDNDKVWATGNVPKMTPVDIDGDTTMINAWYRAESFEKDFVIRVYVECELAEELEEVTAEETGSDERPTDLDPIEISL